MWVLSECRLYLKIPVTAQVASASSAQITQYFVVSSFTTLREKTENRTSSKWSQINKLGLWQEGQTGYFKTWKRNHLDDCVKHTYCDKCLKPACSGLVQLLVDLKWEWWYQEWRWHSNWAMYKLCIKNYAWINLYKLSDEIESLGLYY